MKMNNLITYLKCMSYGTFLGGIIAGTLQFCFKQFEVYPSNIIKTIFIIAGIITMQMFYIKTYKWLIDTK